MLSQILIELRNGSQDWKSWRQIDDTVKKEMQVDIFVIDEFAALRIALDKKEFGRNQWQLASLNYIRWVEPNTTLSWRATSGNISIRWSD